MSPRLNWQCRAVSTNEYLRLNDVILTTPYFDNLRGVYIIWLRDGSYARAVYIGQAKQGLIKDRLYDHRTDNRIQAHASAGTLYVAFAEVPTTNIDGTEKYLYYNLNPLEGDPPYSNADPIFVYLPEVGLTWGY